jgi:outer membrane autotransporter protein
VRTSARPAGTSNGAASTTTLTAANRGIQFTTHGLGFGGSLEGGYPFHFGNGYFIEPQAQLVYQHIDLADSSDIGASVRLQ